MAADIMLNKKEKEMVWRLAKKLFRSVRRRSSGSPSALKAVRV